MRYKHLVVDKRFLLSHNLPEVNQQFKPLNNNFKNTEIYYKKLKTWSNSIHIKIFDIKVNTFNNRINLNMNLPSIQKKIYISS